MNTVFKVWPHQCQVQGDDHFLTLAGHAIPDASQDAIAHKCKKRKKTQLSYAIFIR